MGICCSTTSFLVVHSRGLIAQKGRPLPSPLGRRPYRICMHSLLFRPRSRSPAVFSPRRRRPSPSPVPLKELTPEPSEKESGELEEGEVNAGEVSSAPAGADRAPAAAPAAARAPATAPAPAAGGSAVGAARAPGRDAPKGPGEALPARRRPPSPPAGQRWGLEDLICSGP